MRAFFDVLRFELRLQGQSPLFAGVLLLFFVIHLMTIGEIGINVSDNDLIFLNGPSQIFQTTLVLGVFGVLPAIVFIVNAVVRDYERQTVELFFTTPVGERSWLAGRLVGGTLCALLAGLAGVFGTVAGTVMPWIDAARLAPFDAIPYLVCALVLVLPNLLVFCALCGSVATLTRSQAWTFSVALVLVVAEVVLFNLNAQGHTTWWMAVLEPMGGLAITDTTRNWTVAELNTRLPVTAILVANRAAWLSIALLTAVMTMWRFRLELPRSTAPLRLPRLRRRPDFPAVAAWNAAPGAALTLRLGLPAFVSQLGLDLRSVLLTRLFALIVLLAIVATASEAAGGRDGIGGLPLHPTTALMLDVLRNGLLQFVLLIVIYFSATLVFRERDHHLADIVGALPYGDWLMPAAKVTALGLALTVVMVVSAATTMGWQWFAGHEPLQPAVYAQAVVVYTGFSFYMLALLAVALQVISPGKWIGMVLALAAIVVVFALEPLGLEHVLYGFRIPPVVYSDMNGFGQARLATLSLVAYWACFCVLLFLTVGLLWPRGTTHRPFERLRDARTRLTPGVRRSFVVTAALLVTTGSWIAWNTNVLNRYETAASRIDARAAYEKAYGSWKNRPTPGFSAIEIEVDLYPDERRLESRGTATLLNRKTVPISDVLVTTDRQLHVRSLTLEGADLVREDGDLGVRVFHLRQPLAPAGALRMTWAATRLNQGFVNSGADNEIVANGTYATLQTIAPWPSYDEDRELTDTAERRRSGLPTATRLPALGDAAWLNTLGSGIDGHTDVHVVVSTSGDQIAVAPGALERQWEQGGRRFFEYRMERPTWPALGFMSARYLMARSAWNDVAIEVYHDAQHAWNVPVMLATAREALEYFSREFGPYPLRSFRILEYPRYRTAAQALPGMVAYSESAGFLTDLRGWASLDYTTVHELAHQWWGGYAYGAKMQGRQLLNETMAQYSTLMMFKQQSDPQWLRRLLARTNGNYLDGRSREPIAEQPLMYTEDQGNISYNKGALVMFALQEQIGTERMHQALRAYLATFGFKDAPFPTSRDLVHELRAVAGPDHQQLITDFFERVILYDVAITAARVTPVDSGFEVAVDISARQLEADGLGVEHEVPLDTSFDLVLFPHASSEVFTQTPLGQQRVRLKSGRQTEVVRVSARPGAVAVDPFQLMLDRRRDDNFLVLPPQ